MAKYSWGIAWFQRCAVADDVPELCIVCVLQGTGSDRYATASPERKKRNKSPHLVTTYIKSTRLTLLLWYRHLLAASHADDP